jgi:hypothetical protein
MLVVIKYFIVETSSVIHVFGNMHRIAELCANSKRKRLPALYSLLIPKFLKPE